MFLLLSLLLEEIVFQSV